MSCVRSDFLLKLAPVAAAWLLQRPAPGLSKLHLGGWGRQAGVVATCTSPGSSAAFAWASSRTHGGVGAHLIGGVTGTSA